MTDRSRTPLVFPRGGKDTSEAFGEQPPLTTREGTNVRLRDARSVTKRRRGAQRPGWSSFVDTTKGSKVQRLAQTMVPVSLKDWTVWDGTNEVLEWELVTPGEEVAYDMDLDSQGNLWVLDGAGILLKINSEGKILARINIALTDTETLIPRVHVDELDAVYVGARRLTADLNGRFLRYVRLEEEEGEEYDLAWSKVLGAAPVDFDVRGGSLRAIVESEDASDPLINVISYGNLSGAEPQLEWENAVPRPAHGVVIGPFGDTFVSSPSNDDRGNLPGSEGFTTRTEAWSPHLLTNSEERIYSWIDADTIWGFADGQPVVDWADRRDLAYQQGESYARVFDREPRFLLRKKEDDNGDVYRSPPLFRNKEFGGGAAVRFDGHKGTVGKLDYDQGNDDRLDPAIVPSVRPGKALVTRIHKNAHPKTLSTEALPGSRALLPGYRDARYVWCILVRLDRREDPSVLMAHNGTTPIGIIVNGGEAALNVNTEGEGVLGTIGLYMKGKDAGGNAAVVAGQGTTIKEASWLNTDVNGTPTDNVADVALITVVSNGGGGVNNWYFRLNGEAIDRWQVTDDPMRHSGPDDDLTLLGAAGRQPRRFPPELFSHHQFTHFFESLHGSIVSAICVLADSSAADAPHDLAIDVPDVVNGTSGSIGQVAASGDGGWLNATEVETIEGWLAHSKGCSHVLPHGYADGSKTGLFWDNHPFGGVGNWPSDATYGGFDVPEDTRNLFSTLPVLAKFSPAGQLRWAFAGPGVGYSAEVDSEGDVLTSGAWTPNGLPDQTIIKKIVDKGSTYEVNVVYSQMIEFTANPVSTDFITVDDGTNPAVKFEFGVGVDTDTLKFVAVGVNRDTSMHNLQVVMFLANTPDDDIDITTSLDAPIITLFLAADHDAPGTTTSTGPFIISAWVGGVASTEAWDWTGLAAEDPDNEYPRLWVDDNDDLYVPVPIAGRSFHLDKFKGAGDGDGTTTRLWRLNIDVSGFSGDILPYAVIGDPSIPDFDDPAITGPRYIYLSSDATTLAANIGDVSTLRKYELAVDSPSASPSARDHHLIAIAGGDVLRVKRGSILSTVAASQFTATARVEAAAGFGEIVFVDGFQEWVYIAKTETWRKFVATSGGEVPKGVTLAAFYNGRLVLSGRPDDPHNVYMSAKGDHYDWDPDREYPEKPPAFTFGDSRIGLVPDVVTALYPLGEDLLLIAGDHTLHRLTGDPFRGASLDLLSDITGLAPGRPVARDQWGATYVFETLGGVIRLGANGSVDRISIPIDDELRSINSTLYRVELLWDRIRDGLFVFQVPVGAGGAEAQSWFWERRSGWWDDTYDITGIQPTCSLTVDFDDPADRTTLMGCEDGVIAFHDDAALNDRGNRISSAVVLAPPVPPGSSKQFRFTGLDAVLATDQNGCRWEMYANDDPDALGDLIRQGLFYPGRNPRQHRARARGANLFVRLVNEAVAEAFGVEQVQVGVYPAGRRRVRS